MIIQVGLVPVRSSNLRSVGYDDFSDTLVIVFRSGSKYRYDRVPPEIYDGLMNATSRGRYFWRNIRGRYATTELYG